MAHFVPQPRCVADAPTDLLDSLSCFLSQRLSISVGAAVGFILPATLGLRQMLYLHLAWSALCLVRTLGGELFFLAESPRSLALTFLFFRAAPATPPSPKKHHEAGEEPL